MFEARHIICSRLKLNSYVSAIYTAQLSCAQFVSFPEVHIAKECYIVIDVCCVNGRILKPCPHMFPIENLGTIRLGLDELYVLKQYVPFNVSSGRCIPNFRPVGPTPGAIGVGML